MPLPGDVNAIVEDWMAPPEAETALDEIASPEQEPAPQRLRDRLREVQAEVSRPHSTTDAHSCCDWQTCPAEHRQSEL